jgi:hypothetical protein
MFLGHSDAGFTLRTYVHLPPEDIPDPDGVAWAGDARATVAPESDRNEVSTEAPEIRSVPRLSSAALDAAAYS